MSIVEYKKHIIVTSILFCYIFSFYVIGPVTSSMIISIPCILSYVLGYKRKFELFDKYSYRVITFLILLIYVALIYSVLHFTFDFSYIKTLVGQLIHLIIGIFIFLYLKDRYKCNAGDIELYIIYAFLLQSIIEIVASLNPSFASSLLPFNRAYELQDDTGRRGIALSAGTGWSLALSFGLIYIIYVKRFLLDTINFRKIFGGVVLLVGTMFAGRTGFVGALFAFFLFFYNRKSQLSAKLWFIIKILFSIILCCILFYLLFPAIVNHLINVVFPFAFEPFYKLYYNDSFSTGSTDRLAEMWAVDIDLDEILFGTGNFTEASGRYYKHIDIGIMRNLFYWGILGYLMMIIYQVFLIKPIKIHSNDKLNDKNILMYRCCLFVYLFLMEFKAMTIGFNKLAISVCFILGYFYYNERKNKNLNNYSML